MKLDMLLIATFFILVDFSVTKDLEKKEDILYALVYETYESNLEILRSYQLDYLLKDVDQLYRVGYDMMMSLWAFYETNADLMKLLDAAMETTIECMRNLNDGVIHYRNVVEKLTRKMEETPKNPTCFSDLESYFETIRHSVRSSWRTTDKIVARNEEVIVVLNNEIDRVYDITIQVTHEMYRIIVDELDDYVEQMVELADSKAKKKNIRTQSAKFVVSMKNMSDEYVKDLRENGVINKTNLMKFIRDYEVVHDVCQDTREQLQAELAAFVKHTLDLITTIERFANAYIYTIDDANNKIPVDCEDYIPCFGAKLTEKVLSRTMNDGRMTFVLLGTDKDGREYKRTFITDSYNSKNGITVHEVIEYDDEVLDRKFYVEFDDIDNDE